MAEAMNVTNSPPLYEKTVEKPRLYRIYAGFHLLLMLSFLGYRLLNPLDECYEVWILAFACELWFTFQWILDCNLRWLFVEYTTYPERLVCRYSGESASKLPPVDIIITTADPLKEPAIITANTVLSVLAIDYPVQKISCYISDDSASPITFFTLVETLTFAEKWVPFCMRFDIETRAPFMYFSKQSSQPTKSSDPNFLHEWKEMKDEYEGLKQRIMKLMEMRGEILSDSIRQNGVDGFAQSTLDVRNHSSVVKARVSGVMTNAPFILNLDCDMFVNNSKAIQHAMCFFLDCNAERECGFVQFPQLFYQVAKDNIFLRILARGMNGLQGPLYCGTGCFHRRKALYGVPPATDEYNNKENFDSFGKVFDELKASSCSFEDLRSLFGPSTVLATSAQTIMTNTYEYSIRSSRPLAIDEALNVSSCRYETRTAWGKEVGWMYGSTNEDVITGFKVHCLGWSSVFCIPEKPAFLGSAPANSTDMFIQQKRWATGLLEIFVSKLCPFLGIHRKIMVRQRMMYSYFNLWGIWSVATFCYAVLPAFCLLRSQSFLPGIPKPPFAIAIALFVSSYGFKLWEFHGVGGSTEEWWNKERMWLIVCLSSWLFGTFDVLKKLIGISETVFVVTPKGSVDEDESGKGDFTFDSSSLSVPPTIVFFVNLIAIVVRFVAGNYYIVTDKLFAEYLCSVWVVINLWPFAKGLVRKGKRGIPWIVVIKSTALALLFCAASAKI